MRPGRRGLGEGASDAPLEIKTVMIEVDDSELMPEDHEFLKRWSEALGVSVAVLSGRILAAAIEGDQYVEKRPRD